MSPQTILIPSKTKSNPEVYLQKNPAFIFHHLIKCGGTSAHNALRNWFTLEFDHLLNSNEINKYIKYRFNLENICSDVCIIGHFAQEGSFIFQRYPEIISRRNEIKAFTFIRDPLMFSVSFYYYTVSSGNFRNISLKTHLNFHKNFLSRFLDCNEKNYKEVFDRYFFVGITERMQESFDKLALILNKRKLKVPFVNQSKKDSQTNEITSEFKDNFRKNNKLDYLIYDYCLEKFNRISF